MQADSTIKNESINLGYFKQLTQREVYLSELWQKYRTDYRMLNIQVRSH